MLEIGKKVPAFSLSNQNQEKISLKNFEGKWVVLYFYPKDNTPGCTVEAHDFTKLLKSFEKLSAVVIGVSPDSIDSHCRFIEKQNLKVMLLSDESKTMLEKYNAWGLKKNYGKEYMGVIRSTCLIDPQGKLAYHWKNVKSNGHAEKVLEKLQELV